MTETVIFKDRHAAGRELAEELLGHAGKPETLVLALPRGGVPVGYEVATRLGVPLDVFIVRKLGVPGHRELALGAIAAGGSVILSQRLVRSLGLTGDQVEAVKREELEELVRRERAYRRGRPPLATADRSVILVDDGLATGSTMLAAVAALKLQEPRPRRLTVAVPVAPASACAEVNAVVDELVVLACPRAFFAVGQWYEDFRQTTDDEVITLLQAQPRGA